MKSRSLFVLPLLLSGCSSPQSVLDAYGQTAIALKELIVFIVLVAILIWLTVVICMAIALLRRQRQPVLDSRSERRTMIVVATVTAATALVVAILTVDPVVAGIANDPVTTGAAMEPIIACATTEPVIVFAAREPIVT